MLLLSKNIYITLCFIFIFNLFKATKSASINTIKCEGMNNFTDNQFPTHNDFGNNYELTLRSTDQLRNETAKLLEQNFNGTLVVRKWTRFMEMKWYNRSILFQDYYNMSVLLLHHHLEHNRTCRAIKKTNESDYIHADNTVPLALSSELMSALQIDGTSFEQLLSELSSHKQQYNGSIYSVRPVMGIGAVGWLGCVKNVSGTGRNLQLDIRFAADHTPEQPYNPFWNNPLIYTVDLIFYQPNGSNYALLDALTFDLVALEQVKLIEKEFAATPVRGVFCEGLDFVQLPVKFPENFLSHIQTSVRSEDSKNKDIFINSSQYKFFYHNSSKIVAYNKNLFNNKSNIDEERALIIHDFVYGFQYIIANNGTCQSITPIDTNAPDVGLMTNSKNETILYLLNPEQILIGINKTDKYHYMGKIKATETGRPLAMYATEINHQQMAEVLFEIDAQNNPVTFHSIVFYNGTNGGPRSQQKSMQILMAYNNKNDASYQHLTTPWRILQSVIRPCIHLMKSTLAYAEEINGNGTLKLNNGDFYIQLINVTLSDLEHAVGNERAVLAVAQALTSAANVSQLRIVDLQLKELTLNATINQHEKSHEESFLFALFSIGLPVALTSGITPARTAYFKEEITIEQAAASLNESVRTGQLHIQIPLNNKESKNQDLNIAVHGFGYQSALHPNQPPSPPCPKPSPPKFVGYSGSALAISALFAFVFGAGLVLGGYIFYQKRQHIRGFAYQVFE